MGLPKPGGGLCAALFNLSDRERTVSVPLEELGVPGEAVPAEELWTGERFSAGIKAVLIDERHVPAASGSFDWENRLEDGIWTYSLEEVHRGLQACYADLARDVREKYGVPLTEVGALGVSGMMHGYLPFDKAGKATSPSAGALPTCTRPC